MKGVMRFDATDQIELIDKPLLMIAGSKAESTGPRISKPTGFRRMWPPQRTS